jgi:hypothetical protein
MEVITPTDLLGLHNLLSILDYRKAKKLITGRSNLYRFGPKYSHKPPRGPTKGISEPQPDIIIVLDQFCTPSNENRDHDFVLLSPPPENNVKRRPGKTQNTSTISIKIIFFTAYILSEKYAFTLAL